MEEEIIKLKSTLEKERQIARNGILELSEMNRQCEESFSNTIKELEITVNKLLLERKNKSMLGSSNIEKGIHFREDSSFNLDQGPSQSLLSQDKELEHFLDTKVIKYN